MPPNVSPTVSQMGYDLPTVPRVFRLRRAASSEKGDPMLNAVIALAAALALFASQGTTSYSPSAPSTSPMAMTADDIVGGGPM